MQRIAFGTVMAAMLVVGPALAQAPSWSPPAESARARPSGAPATSAARPTT